MDQRRPPPYNPNPHQYAPSPGPAVIAIPPSSNGVGLFLNEDQPVMVEPGVSLGPEGALQYLKNVTTLVVKQKIEVLEIMTSIDTENRFTIYDETGRTVFYALEESDFCTRQCCGPRRPFEMKILDVFQNEIIHISRPLACQSCCFPCCLMNMEVSSPPGRIVGKVQQQWSIIKPNYSVENAVGETVLKIEGPFCTCSCGGDVEFKVLSADGKTEVGEISKTWAGFVQEAFTDADNFKTTFPANLDVNVKAVLLSALFLIDIMYFEKNKNKNHHR